MSFRIFSVAAAFAVIVVSNVSQAAVLELQAGTKNLEGVNIPTTATLKVEDRETALTTVGAGLRTKKIGFATIKVYVAELLVSAPADFKRTDADALNSTDSMKALALQLTFLRDVDADKIYSS